MNTNKKDDIRSSEREVRRNMDRFDTAMDHLKETIDDGSSKIDHAAYVASTPKRFLRRALGRSRDFATKAQPYANDRRLQVGLLSMLGGLLLGALFMPKESRSDRGSELESSVDLDSPVIHTTVTDERIIVTGGPTV